MNRRTANVRAHGFTTLYVLFKGKNIFIILVEIHFIIIFFYIIGDLVDALRDYPEDRALLAKKSQKARKEVAAKQAANTTAVSKMSKNIIIRLNKEPAMVTALLKLIPKSSKVSKLLTQGSLEKDEHEDNDELLVVEKEIVQGRRKSGKSPSRSGSMSRLLKSGSMKRLLNRSPSPTQKK